MPKTLTEVDQFPSTIVTPSGGDSRNNAAAAVESFNQRLTDRTRYLMNRTAKLAAANAFTAANTFSAATTVNDTLTVKSDASLTPAIVIQRNSGGTYQLLASLPVSSTATDLTHVYSSTGGDTSGALMFVYNAVWNGTAWSLINTAKAAHALILRAGDVRVVGKPANVNPATWTAWETNVANAHLYGGTIISEILQAARVLAKANTSSNYANGFRYDQACARISPIPLGRCWGNVAITVNGDIRRGQVSTNELDQIWFPIPIPPFSTFSQVHVAFYQEQPTSPSQPDQFQLFKRMHAGPWVQQGSAETKPGVSGFTTIDLHPGAAQLVTDAEEWAYRWKVVSGDLAAINNRIVGISVDWSDIGPSNRIG